MDAESQPRPRRRLTTRLAVIGFIVIFVVALIVAVLLYMNSVQVQRDQEATAAAIAQAMGATNTAQVEAVLTRWAQNTATAQAVREQATATQEARVTATAQAQEHVGAVADDRLPGGEVCLVVGLQYAGQGAIFRFDNFALLAP